MSADLAQGVRNLAEDLRREAAEWIAERRGMPRYDGPWIAGRLEQLLTTTALPVEPPTSFLHTVVYHQRRSEGSDGCTKCGPLPVGSSFADHLWQVYRQAGA